MGGLLEREAELATLARAVAEAAGGRGSVVLVGGEAGIGKTSLVRALRAPGSLEGACEPLSVPVPLAPLRERYAAAAGGDLVALGDDRLTLARALLDALATRVPAVAVVEDAHWADPLTLDLLRLLARRVEPRGRLPDSVRDAALARAGRLGGAARAVVDAAAVVGQRIEPDLLEALVPGNRRRAGVRPRAGRPRRPAGPRPAPDHARPPGRPDAARAGGARARGDRREQPGDRGRCISPSAP